MSNRLDPAAPVFFHDTPFSAEALTARPLAVAPQPKAADTLPERYGVAALELLVVDPANIFISWEIAADQLSAARKTLGSSFDKRKLSVDVRLAGDSGELLAHSELFGEVGRWFMGVPPVGREIEAILYFAADELVHRLHQAGPVSLPRISIVAPESYEELHVGYSLGPGGRISLAGIRRASAQPMPEFDIQLKAQSIPGSMHEVIPGSSQQWSGAWHPGRGPKPGARDD